MTFGVVVPLHHNNSARLGYLENAMESIERQKGIKVVIVDDESPQFSDAYTILRRFENRNVRIIHRFKQKGDAASPSAALNLGITHLLDWGVDYITFVHSDDVLLRGALRKRERLLKKYPVVITNQLNINADSVITGTRYCSNFVTEGKFNYVPRHTISWTAQAVSEAIEYAKHKYDQDGVYNRSVFGCDDLDGMMTSFESVGFEKVGYLPEFTYAFRDHDATLSRWLNQKKWREQRVTTYAKHGLEFESYKPNLSSFPWSLGRRLPERLKKQLRRLKDRTRSVSQRTIPELPDSITNDTLVSLEK